MGYYTLPLLPDRSNAGPSISRDDPRETDPQDDPIDTQTPSPTTASPQQTPEETAPIVMTKEVPLLVEFRPDADVSVTEVSYNIDPPSIMLRGDEDSLRYIDFIELGTINLDDYGAEFSIAFPIDFPENVENLSGTLLAQVFVSVHRVEALISPGKIISVSAGEGHTMALDDKGQVWAWGDNYFGQVGNGEISTYLDPIFDDSDDEYWEILDGRVRDVDNDAYTPQYIMSNVKAIYARYNSSFAITNDGELYAWGKNEVGLNQYVGAEATPTPEFVMDNVLDVDYGIGRLLVLKSDNTLWISGMRFDWSDEGYQRYEEPELLYTNVKKAYIERATNNGGVLILTNDNRVINYTQPQQWDAPHEFREITDVRNVVDISVASQQVYLLTSNGDVYGWGAHAGSDLGVEVDEFWVRTPIRIASGIEKLTRGRMLVTANGTLMIWGSIIELMDYRNPSGSDGGGAWIGEMIEYGVNPTSILSDIYIADGVGSHLVALDNNGNVYTWGQNFYGQLGDGTSQNRLSPNRVEFPS